MEVIKTMILGIGLLIGGIVTVVLGSVLVGTIQGFGQYILVTLNSTGTIKAQDYTKTLNIASVMQMVGIALIVGGALVLIVAIIGLAREVGIDLKFLGGRYVRTPVALPALYLVLIVAIIGLAKEVGIDLKFLGGRYVRTPVALPAL